MDEIPLLIDRRGDKPNAIAFPTLAALEAHVTAEFEDAVEGEDYGVRWVEFRGDPNALRTTTLARVERRVVRASPLESPRHNSAPPSDQEAVDTGDGAEGERSWTAYDVVCPGCRRWASAVKSYEGVECYFRCEECSQYVRF